MHTKPMPEIYSKQGKKGEAEKTLNGLLELSKKKYVPPGSIAATYSILGQKDEAFEWLEKSFQEHSIRMSYLKDDDVWDNIRDDQRFKDLVRRVGLPQ